MIRVLLTVGGDRLPYAHDSSSPAASLLDDKLIINSVISTPGSRFISADINPQPKDGCPLITDNLTSQGILTKLIKPRKSKTWDMPYHWLEDQFANKEINLIWKKGEVNGADYSFTKHFPGSYHATKVLT